MRQPVRILQEPLYWSATIDPKNLYVKGASKRMAPSTATETRGATKMNVKPLSDRILIRRMEEGEVKRGGIIIPDTAKEKPQQAEVVAVGPGRFEDGKRIPPEVKKGDKVLIGRYGGTEIKLEGDDFLIISETEILAIID